MKTLTYIIGITALLAGSAAAQNPSPQGNQPGQAQNQDVSKSGAQNQAAKSGGQNQQSIAQQVRGDLAKAGYSDVDVVPESFLVKAKDKDGHNVMMIINPDSFLSVTEVSSKNSNSAGKSSGETTGRSSTGTPGNTNKANSPAESPAAVPASSGK